MKIKERTLVNGFIASGVMNIAGVLILSRFFTNKVIPEFDAVVMSNFGLLMILVWGLVFVAIARSYKTLKWLVGVFVIEKLIYGCVWIQWLMSNNLSSVYEKDILAGVFYSIYGVNDWLFFLFFLFVFLRLSASRDA